MGDYGEAEAPADYGGDGNGEAGVGGAPPEDSHGDGTGESDVPRDDPSNAGESNAGGGGGSGGGGGGDSGWGESGRGEETSNREEKSAEEQGMKLFVGGIPFRFTDQDLATHFEGFGKVVSANVSCPKSVSCVRRPSCDDENTFCCRLSLTARRKSLAASALSPWTPRKLPTV
eukprot:1009735-Rhodomonas_salina.1